MVNVRDALVALLAVCAVAMAACDSGGVAEESKEPGDDSSTTSISTATSEAVENGRASDGGGQPRPVAYWMEWNRCADRNRSAEADANGGRAAGWVLVDDLIADPGMRLGDHDVSSCEEAIVILRAGLDGATGYDPSFALAAHVFSAEMNLSVGAETCPLAEEAVVGAHLVLSAARFDAVTASPLDAEGSGALPELISLLQEYNLGSLCR